MAKAPVRARAAAATSTPLNWLRDQLSRVTGAKRPKAYGGFGPYDPALWALLGGYGATEAGVVISPSNALEVPAIYAAIKLLSESVAQLPLKLRRWDDGREAYDHPLYDVLLRAANSETTAYSFREQLMTDLLLHGNSFAYKARNRAGETVELWNVPAEMVSVDTEKNDLTVLYRVTGNDNVQRQFTKQEILHLKTLGTRSHVGESPIWRNREAIGLALVLQQHTARIFSNGARPSGVMKHPGRLSAEIVERLRSQLKDSHAGKSSGGTMILEEGLEFQQTQFSSVDAQLLELRQHQFAEIARIFNIPLPLLQDLDRATHSNAEQMAVQFLRHSLQPWLVNIEQAVDLFVLGPQRSQYYAAFELDAFTRAETSARYSAYVAAISNGLMSANEIRERENLPPYPGGDEFRMPLNQGAAQTRAVESRRALENHLRTRPLITHERGK